MADDMADSFQSFGNGSTSSFRILNPASELPGGTRTASAPSVLGDSAHDWDNTASAFGHLSQRSIGADSYGSPKSSIASGNGIRPAGSAATVRASVATTSNSVIRVPSLAATSPTSSTPKKLRVMKREVWRDIVQKSDGRDKAFKLIQYSIRVYLWFHSKVAPLKFGVDMNKRLRATMSGLSLVRKCLILFNWLTPLLEITNPPPLPYASGDPISLGKVPPRSLLHRFLHASPPLLIDFFNAIADDTFTFHRLGLIPAHIGHRADRLANWLWFLATLAGLIEVETDLGAVKALMNDLDNRIYDVELDPKAVGRGTGSGKAVTGLAPSGQPNKVDLSVGVDEASEGLGKLRKQSKTLRITRWKLLMDLIFVSYDVFRIKRFREPVLSFSGLASAILSSYKIYDKHHAAVAKSRRLEA